MFTAPGNVNRSNDTPLPSLPGLIEFVNAMPPPTSHSIVHGYLPPMCELQIAQILFL